MAKRPGYYVTPASEAADEAAERMERRQTATRSERKKIGAIIREARKAERVAGDGKEIGGTGFTILRFTEPTISRLVTNGRIGPHEMRAIDEIDRVYCHLCAGMFRRAPTNMEKLDKGKRPDDPAWFLDAYHQRYLPWANEWSRRRKQNGDLTLEIVYDILFSDRSGREIDRDHGWRNGTAVEVFIAGVRDYAAIGGWPDRSERQAWTDMARRAVPLHRMPANRA